MEGTDCEILLGAVIRLSVDPFGRFLDEWKRPVLDVVGERQCSRRPIHRRGLQDLLQDLHQLLVRPGPDANEDVSLAGDRMGLDDLGNRGQMFDHLVGPALDDLDGREPDDVIADPGEIDVRAESDDDAGVDHLVESRLDRSPRHTETPRHLEDAEPWLLPPQSDDVGVEVVDHEGGVGAGSRHPLDPTQERTCSLRNVHRPFVLAVAFLVVACSTSADESPNVEPPPTGKLIAWSTDSIQVYERPGSQAEGDVLETAGFEISQVTPSSGGRIAWTALDAATSTYRTMLSSATGGQPDEIVVPTAPFFYAWSPTDARLAFLGNDPGGAGVLFGSLDPETGVSESHGIATPFFLDWAPDGSQVIANIGGATLGFVDVPEGTVTDSGIRPGLSPAPIWTTDGVVVVARRSPSVGAGMMEVSLQAERGRVQHVDPSTGEQTTLMDVDVPVRLFASADGSRLAAVTGTDGDQRLSVHDRAGTILAERRGPSIELVQWSPDAGALLYTIRSDAGRERTPHVWLASGDEDLEFDPFVPSVELESTYLPFWDQYDRALTVWAPDSSMFALANQDGIRLLSIDGGIEEITGSTMAVFAPSP